MSGSPESMVRKFYASWADPKSDELGSFFDDGAVWVDGAQGVYLGVDAIKSELAAQLTAVGGVMTDVKTLVSDGRTVMVQHRDTFSIAGNPISTVVMAVFELGTDGRINQFREAYDLKSVTDQMEAAGFTLPK